jgi:membrane protease YdiL (CAAX protease family)
MRDGLAPERLGLEFNAPHARAFAIGTAIAVGHIFVLLVALYLVAPFQFGAGPIAAREVPFAAINYLTGNFVEELLFRGYLLIALSRWLGATRALWMLAVLFGLFHFPGLDPVTMGKMMLTTGAMHFVYAYAFLATRSLWASVALHAVGNTLLHKVVGVDEPALLSMRFERALPDAVDAPFLVFFGITAALAIGLAHLPATRRGAVWLQSA